MPVQQQMSSFAKKHGNRVAHANEEHKDKPVDMGMQRLPAGIKNGTAKLSSMYTSEYKEGDNKGKLFFRASAIVVSPESFDGCRIAGSITSQVVTLDDVPAKGLRKAKTFEEGYGEMQNLIRLCGVPPCPETKQTDPTGQKAEAYWFAAMKALTDPQRPPVYIRFSTRGWTPPATPLRPKPEEMVFEEWHGLADVPTPHDPAAGFTEANGAAAQPDIHTPPPEPFNEFAAPISEQPLQWGPGPVSTATAVMDGAVDPADEVASLVEVAMNDPEGATEEGRAASARLEELAWKAGATKEQTAAAADWAAVAEMALGITPATAAALPEALAQLATPTVGAKYRFAKRTKEGAKLKNAKGEEFPAQDVEVTSVDMANRTCTLKTVKDNKDVVDIRSKKPVPVKWEWLESKPA